MADFAALNAALSALYASRRAIEVTGQNLANVNTDGYSRQRVDLQANQGPVLPALFSRWPGGGASPSPAWCGCGTTSSTPGPSASTVCRRG